MMRNVDYLLARLQPVFMRRPVVAHAGAVYRLSEVGPHRFDARWLDRALPLVAGDALISPEPYVYAGLTGDESVPVWDDAAHVRVHDTLRRLAQVEVHDVVRALGREAATQLRSRLGGRRAPLRLEAPAAPATPIGAGFALPRPTGGLIHRDQSGAAVLVWVTYEVPWLGPDDPRLWLKLEEAAALGVPLLIIARKVAPATFPVLKALGAAAVQVSWFFAPSGADDETVADLADAADAIGWGPVRTPRRLAEHGAWAQLADCAAAAKARGPAEHQAAMEALAVARLHARTHTQSQLGTSKDLAATMGGPGLGPTELRAWASAIGLSLPEQWHDTLACWAALGAATSADALPPTPFPRRAPIDEHSETDERGPDDMNPTAVVEERLRNRTARGRPIPTLSRGGESPLDASTVAVRTLTPTQPHSNTIVVRHRVAATVDPETWAQAHQRQGPAAPDSPPEDDSATSDVRPQEK